MTFNKLAIHGGKPVREKYLPYSRQWIDEQDIKMVVEILRGDYLTTGPNVNKFERDFADYVGAKYAVAVSNGTAALHAACHAAGIKEGDEVITTPMTFAASSNCILYQQGIPVFVDIDSRTYNIDTKEIIKKINKRTKAIIPVDFTGQPANLEEIINIAKEYNLIVIEDAAHSLGATYKGKKVGSIADMTEFSLHPVKNITTGEGGVITTNDEGLYDSLLLFRSHGIRDSRKMEEGSKGWYYEQIDLGYNYRITDIQCALGISQLRKSDRYIKRRRQIAEIYNKAFKDIKGLIIPFQEKECDSSWHLYILQLELEKLKVDRRTIFEALRAENIGVNVHYIPVYYHPYYKKLGYKRGICPEAEKLYERIITLPLFPKMTDDDVLDVINAVEKVISFYRK